MKKLKEQLWKRFEEDFFANQTLIFKSNSKIKVNELKNGSIIPQSDLIPIMPKYKLEDRFKKYLDEYLTAYK